ncbi:MAG: hypothetical protein PHH26_03010, partial [Candidatus Thermoplasmatota archaeon]|nr:hypothetical protein [Candidatus Thermoplasmatota archaeon]
ALEQVGAVEGELARIIAEQYAYVMETATALAENVQQIQTDADGDGYTNTRELNAGSDPTDPHSTPYDLDGDGLTNSEERDLGSDPSSKDSDNDGIGDYDEVYVYGTDPTNADTDGDGIWDSVEILILNEQLGQGSDPNNVNSPIPGGIGPDTGMIALEYGYFEEGAFGEVPELGPMPPAETVYDPTTLNVMIWDPNSGEYIPLGAVPDLPAPLNDIDQDGIPNSDDSNPATAGSLTVTAPNGGEKIRGTYPITWSDDWTAATYDVKYVSGTSETLIATGVTSKSVDWVTMGLADGANYKIRITSNHEVSDESDAVFTIDNTAPAISNIATGSVECMVTLTATLSDASGISNYSIAWGDGTIEEFTVSGSTDGTPVAISENHNYSTSGSYNIILTVYDNAVDGSANHNSAFGSASVTITTTPTSNSAPELIGGGAIAFGDPSMPANVLFLVNYTDADGDAPEYVKVKIIDGPGVEKFEDMKEIPSVSASGKTDYTKAVTYYLTTKLEAGKYTYNFIASDGKGDPLETDPAELSVGGAAPSAPNFGPVDTDGDEIPDAIWIDQNGDGVQDEGEVVIPMEQVEGIVGPLPAPEGIITQITDAINTVVAAILDLPNTILDAVNGAIGTLWNLIDDTDGDGYSNSEEILANSDPTDPSSTPSKGSRLLPL